MLSSQELVWLLAAVAKGDRAAFERLYAATRAKLYGVVLRILRRHDLADEVMQETYLKIWNSAGQFDPALSSPITWMVAIARNRAIDQIRKKTEVSIEENSAVLEVAAAAPRSSPARRAGPAFRRQPRAPRSSPRSTLRSSCGPGRAPGCGRLPPSM